MAIVPAFGGIDLVRNVRRGDLAVVWVLVGLLSALSASAVLSSAAHAAEVAGTVSLYDLGRSRAWWLQAQAGASIYDGKREVIAGRLSPGMQAGWRHKRRGFYLHLEFERNFDFNQEVRRLDVFHIGPGIETLYLLGNLRSSLSVGLAVLASDTDAEGRGRRGWYADLRPLSWRSRLGGDALLEFTPLSVDVSVPVPNGLPLVILSYMTLLSVEWAREEADK